MNDSVTGKLPQVTANLIHHAIAKRASEYSIESDSFSIDMNQSVHLFDSGGVSMASTLCSYSSSLNILKNVLERNKDEISGEIQNNLTIIFMDAMDSDALIVKLSLTDWVKESIYLVIKNFDAFSSKTLEQDQNLQKAIVNITYDAVIGSAQGRGVNSRTFWMDLTEAVSLSDYDLYITQTVYTLNQSIIDILNQTINRDGEQINEDIKHHMIMQYLNGYDTEGMTVALSLLSIFDFFQYIWSELAAWVGVPQYPI